MFKFGLVSRTGVKSRRHLTQQSQCLYYDRIPPQVSWNFIFESRERPI
jgi:hypothetical protein